MKDARVYIKSKRYPGVRWREHPERKHGVAFDRYFVIRYKLDGKDRQESLGWATQGWTEQKANARLAELKEAQRTGQGAVTLAAKRAVAKAQREHEQAEQDRLAREGITFAGVWEKYFPLAQQNKSERSWQKEDQCFRLWIASVLGSKPLKDIAPIHLERIKKNMAEAGRAPRSATYCLAVVRQLFNFARDHDLFAGQNPVTKVKKPSADNRRVRFLTHDEADRLLDALAERSPQVHDQALLSLHCGLRAGEIFALTWADVDLDRGVLTLRDTKSGKTRAALMTDAVSVMLAARKRGAPNELVFPARGGGKIIQVSDAFDRTVRALGLNAGVEDARQKVVFHSLRHTFASWLVEQGVDIYVVKELMGHGNLSMTERYSHLSPDKLRRAVKTLEAGIEKAAEKKVVSLTK
ncbi:MAG: integrase [Acidobacteria bacterium]|nr:MAG: integrase [Acidobacteriota bacterium]